MKNQIIQISLAILFLFGGSNLIADNIDLTKYESLIPAKIDGWESEDIKTIKLGSGDNNTLKYRMYRNKSDSIEVQITANYILLSDVFSMLNTPQMYPEASTYSYKQFKGVITKEDGDVNIQFLSDNQLLVFGLTLLGKADKLSQKELTKVVDGFLEKFDLAKLK